MRAALISLALCSTLGCAALKPRPLDPGLFLLSPQSAAATISVSQSLVFSKGDKRFESVAALEVSPEAVSLAGLGPLGNRMLALRWDGKKLEKEISPGLPPDLPLELILRDVELAFWPAAAVRDAISSKGWTLVDEGNKRTLLKGGQDVVRIRYDGASRWHSNVIFEHIGLGYRLDINSLSDNN